MDDTNVPRRGASQVGEIKRPGTPKGEASSHLTVVLGSNNLSG